MKSKQKGSSTSIIVTVAILVASAIIISVFLLKGNGKSQVTLSVDEIGNLIG